MPARYDRGHVTEQSLVSMAPFLRALRRAVKDAEPPYHCHPLGVGSGCGASMLSRLELNDGLRSLTSSIISSASQGDAIHETINRLLQLPGEDGAGEDRDRAYDEVRCLSASGDDVADEVRDRVFDEVGC